MSEDFVPPFPPRNPGPVPAWRGFFGERARTAVHGWSQQAFDTPYMRRRVLGYTVHIPIDPDLVQQVLLDRAAHYSKPSIVKALLAPVIGEGLLTADGAHWRDQRRIVAASFTPPAVDRLVPLFERSATAIAGGWTDGQIIDAQAQSTAATMRIIADSLFAGDPRLTSDAAIAHITFALEAFGEARIQALLGLPVVPVTRRGLRGRRGQTFLRRTLTQIVRERGTGRSSGDFLDGLIGALRERFEPGQAEALAIDNAATFYLAGHETTANAVTWTLFLLSRQPELQDRVAQEAKESRGGGDTDQSGRLALLRRVIDEALRLYPPAPRMDREAIAADRLGDSPVEPGDIVSIWPWLIHRSRRLWDEPDAFRPDRWNDESKAGRHRFQYLPFGGGPRTCVGARFAMSEALAIVSSWLERWRFEPVPGHCVALSGMVTLRPRNGMPLIVTERK